VTEHGTFRGGYYPVKYDPTRSRRAAEFEARKDAEVGSMFASNASIQSSVNAGATNTRTGFYDPIHLTLNVVPNHIQETIHYITHHDAVREVNKLLRDPRIADAVSSKLGPDEFAQLKPWLNDIAKDGRNAPNKSYIDAIYNQLRMGTTLGVMGYKATTSLLQLSGWSNTVAEVGLGPAYQAARTVLGSFDTMQSAMEFAFKNSKVLNHRVQTMDREVASAMKDLTEGVWDFARGPDDHTVVPRGVREALPSLVNTKRMYKGFQEASMKPIAYIQTYLVDLPSWHAAYIKELGESGDEQKAFQYADWVVENIQGSGLTKDLPSIMRNQSKMHKTATMFMTFYSAMGNAQRDLIRGAKSGKYSTSTLAGKAAFMYAIPVLLGMLVAGEFGGDDDDADALLQKSLLNVALYPLQTMPWVRDVANGVFSGYRYQDSPVTSVMASGLQAVKGVVKAVFSDGELTTSQVKSISKLAGAAIGFPGVNQLWGTGEHLFDVLKDGEELTLGQLVRGPDHKKR
jgi:hypothetical protein